MNTTIGVYSTHEKAIEAVEALKSEGYPIQQVSLIGKAVIVDDLMKVKYTGWKKNIPVMTGAILGPCLGILAGVNLFAIPGFGFLSGTGAAVGALAGFSIGIVAGGVFTLISTLLVKSRAILTYKERIVEKGFQVIAHGTPTEIQRAKEILEKYKTKLG
jgi:uncharacterized membrane protein